MRPSTWRRAVIRIAEVVLNAKFIVPFAAIVLILAAMILYLVREAWVAGIYRQAVTEASRRNYSKAEELFKEFALDYPSRTLTAQAREEAKFCSIMQEVQTGTSGRQDIVRLGEAFLADFPQSAHADAMKNTVQQLLFEDGQSLHQDGKKERSAARMEKAIPLLERAVNIAPHGPLAPDAQELVAAVQRDMKTIQDEDAFALAKKGLMGRSNACLEQKKFAALRAEIAGLTAKFPFAAGDAEIGSLLRTIKERELAASSFVRSKGTARKETTDKDLRRDEEGNTFILMQRQVESAAKGVDGEVVFLLAKGRCLALDAASGECRWTMKVGSAARTVPVVVRDPRTGRPAGALIASPNEGALRLVSAADGAPKWAYHSPAPFVASPLVVQSEIYLPTLNDGLHVLNAETGALEGKYWFDGEIRNAPVLDAERRILYILPENGCIYVVSLDEKACKQIISNVFDPYLMPCSPVLVGNYFLLVEYQTLQKMRVKIFSRDESGLNLRAIRVGDFDIGENVGCRPVVAAGSLYSITETGTLKIHGVNVRSEDAPLFAAADHWPPTFLAGNYDLMLDTETSPFKSGISNQNAILACGSGLAVYRFDAAQRKAEEVWRFPPGGSNDDFIPGEAFLPPQRVGNLVCISTIAPNRDGAFLTAVDLEQKGMAWQVIAGAAAGTPVVDEGRGRVFVRNRFGSLYSLPAGAEGKHPKVVDNPFITAKATTESPQSGPYYLPAAPGANAQAGRVYLGLADNAIHAVSAEDATPLRGWEEPFRTQAPSGPLMPLGKDGLVFGTTRGAVFAASLAHSKGFCQEFTDPSRCSYAVLPAVGPDGAVYMGDSRGYFHKLLLAEQGGTRYLKAAAQFRASGPIRAGAALAGDRVFVGDANGALYALDASTLGRVEEWALGAPVSCDLAPSGGAVFAASEAGCVYCVSAGRKEPVWRFPKEGLAAGVRGRPLVLGQYVLIGAEDGKVYALRRETGEPAWTCDAGSGISAGLAVMGRRLVAPCADGTVKMIALPNEVK